MRKPQPRKASYPEMKPREYEGAMESCALPATRFTEMIGVSWRHGERYRDGTAAIPDPVAKLIRTILKHQLHPEDVG